MPSNPCRLVALALVLSFPACTDVTTPESPDPKAPPSSEPAQPELRPTGPGPISDRFVSIDSERLILVDDLEAQARGVYRFRVQQEPDRIAGPGDFIQVGGSSGRLRRVVAASRAGGEVVFTTMEAFWHEVIVGGTYTFSSPLPSWRPGAGPDGSAIDPSAPLPELGQTVDSVDLCPVVDSLVGLSLICTRKERTRIDRGPVQVDARIDKVFLVKGSATITGDMDGTYTIDPGGSIIPGSGRAPVFSPCNELPHLVGCFAKAGDALRSFLIWVGINPNVLPPFRMCVPGTVLVVDPGSFFPFRAPVLRVCRITDFGALPDFTPPGLRSAVVVLRPRLAAELVVDVVASGTLKLTIPIPGMAVVKCVGFRVGFFCLKAGAVIPLQLHVVDVGGQLQLKGETLETVVMTWTPETEWTHQWENRERSFQGNFIGNNSIDTTSFRFGSGFVLGAELCFGAVSESGCVDQGDGTTGEGGLLDLQVGVKAKAQVSHNMEGVWSRDPTFDNWHIDIDGFDELELEGGLILPRILLRLDKNLKRNWTVQCCRFETEDLHGTGTLDVTTRTTGNVGDPDGYQVRVVRADTLPLVSDPGTTRLSPPNWADTLTHALGINETYRFPSSSFCGVLYSDQVFVSVPVVPIPGPTPSGFIVVPFNVLVPAARRLGIGPPNFAWEAACGQLVADYIVTLSEVADHCRVVGGPSQPVRLVQARRIPLREGLATVVFQVECHDPAAMPGSLEVSATTTGVELDPDGYAIQLDGMTQFRIPANGSGSLSGLDPGLGRLVGLTGLARNCQARTGDQRRVDITPGGTAVAQFEVACLPKVIPLLATSSLRVTTITTGASPDLDGYTLQLNGVAGGSIGANAEALLSDLRAGMTDVVLGGVATNCAVSGGTWVKLDLPAGGVAALTYTVGCNAVADAPTTGSVRVLVATNGLDPDPDGYLLDVGGIAGAIDVNAERTVDGLTPGTALVRLDGVAPNCGVRPDLPLTVQVSVDVTTAADLTVQCQAYGRLEVTTTRTGNATDSDGYRLVVDDIDRGPLGTSETRTFSQIVAGEHAVQLNGLAPNCRIDVIDGKPGHRKRNAEEPALPNPVMVTMAPGESVPVGFVVACVPPDDVGALRIRVKQQGQGAGSYQAFVDGVSRGTVTAGGEVLVTGLFPESHRVHLEVIPVECQVNGQHPRIVNLPRGETHPVEFTLVCGKGKP